MCNQDIFGQMTKQNIRKALKSCHRALLQAVIRSTIVTTNKGGTRTRPKSITNRLGILENGPMQKNAS
jgi:hypothetical protein